MLVQVIFSRLKRFWHFFFPQRCGDWLPEVAPHGCGMSSLAKRFFEWTELRALEAPAGLPQAGRRPAEKTGAGFIYVMNHLIGRGYINLVRKKRRNKR
ncbi:hypothetical protein AP3564_08670 [Aeribacillus pallidus]|uniref:Uncharacterized protein n=2 Tax=Aeribacillus pallidus TaxID=33936 RepID=A0A223E4V2_9BACI|nr:hypothetical protein AP3564_08670 [Aeribacillus pallidus]